MLEISFKRVYQMLYASYFVLSANTILKFSDAPLVVSCNDALASRIQCLLYFAMGCFMVGCARLKSIIAQRKVMQYLMVMPLAKLAVIYSNVGGWDIVMVPPIADLLLKTVVVYCFTPKADKSTETPPKNMLNLLRFLYVSSLAYAVYIIFIDPVRSDVYGSSGASISYCLQSAYVVIIGMSCGLMAVAQCDEPSAKVLLQYGMVLPLVYLFDLFPATVSAVGGAAVKGSLPDACFSWISIMLTVCVLYPAPLRTAIIRATYVFYAFGAYVHILHPLAASQIFLYATPLAVPVANLVGALMFLVSLVLMAAAQSDVGHSQLKLIQYSIFGDLVLLVSAAVGGSDFGLLLEIAATKSLVVKAVDIYFEQHDMVSPTFGGLFASDFGIVVESAPKVDEKKAFAKLVAADKKRASSVMKKKK
ncbi:unnamed protein product [Amoebophrya sp. A25]|nr:unnamed protein product [Amoebophrya sp. A25]|eukprot:GSA25T00004393001.1